MSLSVEKTDTAGWKSIMTHIIDNITVILPNECYVLMKEWDAPSFFFGWSLCFSFLRVETFLWQSGCDGHASITSAFLGLSPLKKHINPLKRKQPNAQTLSHQDIWHSNSQSFWDTLCLTVSHSPVRPSWPPPRWWSALGQTTWPWQKRGSLSPSCPWECLQMVATSPVA